MEIDIEIEKLTINNEQNEKYLTEKSAEIKNLLKECNAKHHVLEGSDVLFRLKKEVCEKFLSKANGMVTAKIIETDGGNDMINIINSINATDMIALMEVSRDCDMMELLELSKIKNCNYAVKLNDNIEKRIKLTILYLS